MKKLAQALVLTFALAGCAGVRPAPPARGFPLPPRPTAQVAPARPAIHHGDVIPGRLEEEEAPRVCFLPGKWREVLAYLIALEARARSEAVRLSSHIEKLERQIDEMNRFIKEMN
ncbi:hypothetical protein ACFLQ0_03375 [Nitrospinota bacterium]